MKTKLLISVLIIPFLLAGCGLDTSGRLGPETFIDAPEYDALVTVDIPVAIMAHTTRVVTSMDLYVNNNAEKHLDISSIGDGLTEATGYWTPIAAGSYMLHVRANLAGGGHEDSEKVRVTVLTTYSGEMKFLTPTPTALPTEAPTVAVMSTETPWLPAQISFSVDRPNINLGECTLLHWKVIYASGVYLNDEFVPQQGERQICPTKTSIYRLHVENPSGNVDQELMVNVILPTATQLPPTKTPKPTKVSPTKTPIPSATIPPDTTGPNIKNLSFPSSIYDSATCGPTEAQIRVNVSDPSGVSNVDIYYRVVKGNYIGKWVSLSMAKSGKLYQRTLYPKDFQNSLDSYSGGWVEFYIIARDGRGNNSQSPTQKFEIKVCLI